MSLQRPKEFVDQITRPYDATAVRCDPPLPDGFRPRNVEPMAVLEALGLKDLHMNLQIISTHICSYTQTASAHVRLTFFHLVKIGKEERLTEEHRDGLGAVRLRDHGDRPDWALKAAVTDGIKLAAKHAGKGWQIWQPESRGEPQEQQFHQPMPPNAAMPSVPPAGQYSATVQTIQPFQLAMAVNFLEQELGWQRHEWLGHLGISAPEQISPGDWNTVINGIHNLVLTKTGGQARRPTGIKSSDGK